MTLATSGSRTAELVAAVRAAHTRHHGGELFDDPYAQLLLRFPWSAIARHRWLYQAFSHGIMGRVRFVHTQVLLRARVAQDQMLLAMAQGARQALILGAGLDSFALKHGATHSGTRIFEVDHPYTQQSKRERLARAELIEPPGLVWVPVDFEFQEVASELLRAGWDRDIPSVASWMGTTYYLSPHAIQKTLQGLRHSMTQGCRLVLDHGLVDEEMDAQACQDYETLRRFVAGRGEPMVSRFARAEFAELAHACGFAVRQVWTPEEVRQWPGLGTKWPYSGFSNFVLLQAA